MTERYDAAGLEAYAQRVLGRLGAPDDIGAEVARHLVAANLAGHDSHGVLRLAQYAGQAARGELLPAARPVVERESPTTVVIDAKRGFGHYAAAQALERASAKAHRMGVAVAAVRHSTHVGRLGDFTERCARHGLVFVMTVGMAGPGVGGVVIHGGRDRFFGANVWSIGVPAEGDPMVFDGSMASIAVGKVYQAQAEGASLSPGCLVDRDGRPSTDPRAYAEGGAVLPLGGALGGHKGYGLGLASALLGGLAMIGDPEPTMAGAPVAGDPDARGRVAGVVLIAIDPEAFGGLVPYRAMVEDCLAAARDARPADGHGVVRVPGDASRRTRAERAGQGIPLPAAVGADLAALARRLDVAPPTPMSTPIAALTPMDTR